VTYPDGGLPVPGEPVGPDGGLPAPGEPVGPDGGGVFVATVAGGDRVTGDGRVDEALGALAAVADRPPAEQVDAYESVHQTLQETLRGIEQV